MGAINDQKKAKYLAYRTFIKNTGLMVGIFSNIKRKSLPMLRNWKSTEFLMMKLIYETKNQESYFRIEPFF